MDWTKEYWLIVYDLPSECRNDLTRDQKTFLNTKRLQIARCLDELGAIRIQDSLWVLCKPQRMIGEKDVKRIVAENIERWKEIYAEVGYTNVSLQLFPVVLDSAGESYIRACILRQLFERVYSIESRVDSYIKRGSVQRRSYESMKNDLLRLRQVFIEELGSRHSRWFEFEKTYMRVADKLETSLKMCVR